VREEPEAEVGSSAGFILDVGSRRLSADAAAWLEGARAAGGSGVRMPQSGPMVS
jgi:hypothetical protein